MQQVLLNLLLNAAEAMGSVEEGARELVVSTQRDQAGVLVAVRDSGPGIDPAHLDRIFDAFYTTKSSGTGMGLSICRSIIHAHGGKLWAGANEPRGAVFQFTLPATTREPSRLLFRRASGPESRTNTSRETLFIYRPARVTHDPGRLCCPQRPDQRPRIARSAPADIPAGAKLDVVPVFHPPCCRRAQRRLLGPLLQICGALAALTHAFRSRDVAIETPQQRIKRRSVVLSDKSRPVIQATLPAVGAHIQEIAQCFYRKLFSAHPELLDGTFNRGNQADGTQQQALAGSVAAFATSLVNTPDQLPESLLSRIAHKHTSLGIKPEQYQVVHENLMPAIAEVLGDAVTPDVAAAWDEVYWLMAYTLTHVERGLYGARGVRPQTVWRQWEVEKKIHETDDVVTFVVKRIEDHLVKPSLPGQYISVQVPLPDGTRQPRQYSLSRADQGESRQFTVKRVYGAAGKPDGEASTLLHTSVRVGDVLSISVPFGPLVLDDYSGRPMVFISAGIGITPMAGMLAPCHR